MKKAVHVATTTVIMLITSRFLVRIIDATVQIDYIDAAEPGDFLRSSPPQRKPAPRYSSSDARNLTRKA